jgi:hypothetical protein
MGQDEGQGNRRRAKRAGVAWPAVIKHGHRSWSCTIVNLSKTGARLRLIGSVPPKATVQLVCDRFGALAGVIMWHRGELAGLEFRAAPGEVEAKLASLMPRLEEREPAPPPAEPRLFGRLPRRQ